MSEVVGWYDNSIYLKASFHDFSCSFILFFVFRGEFQLAKEEDIVKKVFFLKENSANPCLVHCLTSMECG